jgi:hypothetical protein
MWFQSGPSQPIELTRKIKRDAVLFGAVGHSFWGLPDPRSGRQRPKQHLPVIKPESVEPGERQQFVL